MIEEELSEGIHYYSFFSYSPRGRSGASGFSRTVIRNRVKNDDEAFIAEAVASIQVDELPALAMRPEEHRVVVPVPGSKPHSEEYGWPALRIAEALVENHFGTSVWCGLRRFVAVPSACHARAGQRPTLERHLKTIRVTEKSEAECNFLLVDDVITKGTILSACASLLSEAFPRSRITGFALINTIEPTATLERVVDPQCGTIQIRNGLALRSSWRERVLSERSGFGACR